MIDQLRPLLEKIPLVPALLLYGAYLGYDYYAFQSDPGSALNHKQQQIQIAKQETTLTQEKARKAKEFYQTLEARREELRKLALQLEEAKASLSEQMDVSSFIKMVVGEAKKVGMAVDGIRPTDSREKEYYLEQAFELKFHGVFVQLVVFLERLANLERIIRIGQFHVKPVTPASAAYVQLDGTIELETYKYRGSKADELGKSAPTQPQPKGTGK